MNRDGYVVRWNLGSGAMRLVALVVVLGMVGIAWATGSCGSNDEGLIRVYAASSLSEAFLEAADNYEALSKDSGVSITFGSSATLATQVAEGAPASIFASANEEQMLRVVAAGRIDTYSPLATNSLVIASASSRALTFKDLAEPGVRLVIGAKDVPIGAYAREAITKAGLSGAYGPRFADRVLANVRSEEANAGAVVAKLQLGEADAAIVYATDTLNRPGITSIAIDPRFNVTALYLVGLIRGSGGEARQFLDFLLGPEGQAILAKHGFGRP